MKEQKIYSYSYNAAQKNEVEKIVEKYREKTPSETAAQKIKQLDGTVEKKATSLAIVIGVIGALLLGVGMCCTMVWQSLFALGVIIGESYLRAHIPCIEEQRQSSAKRLPVKYLN